MELNFDKEMDAILRQTALGEKTAPAPESHLDVDELAAFSANALPVKARERAMLHLVDCGNCRTILSNLVFFEEEPEEGKAAGFAAATPIVKEKTLIESILGIFTLPTLAYGMAGIVVLLAAGFVFVILRGNSGSEIAKLDADKIPPAAASRPVSSDSAANSTIVAPAANSNSAMSAANTAAAANTAMGGAFTPSTSAPSGYTNAARGADEGESYGAEEKTLDKIGGQPAGGVTIDAPKAYGPPAPLPSRVLANPEPVVPAKAENSPANGRSVQPVDSQLKNNTDMVQQQQQRNGNTMMPDGADNRSRKSINTEAGAAADTRREATRDDAKEDKDKSATAVGSADAAANKPETKKSAKKLKNKKNNPAESPAASKPSPSPKPDDEEREEMNPSR